MIGTALGVAGLTLVTGLAATLLLRRLPSLRLRVMALAGLAALLPLGSVLLSGAVMFTARQDLSVLIVAVAASTAALVGAAVLAGSIVGSVTRLSEASAGLAAGDLSTRAPADGPAELVQLARAFNEMAHNMEQLFAAHRDLVAAASHDLRTPIAAVRAMIEAIDDGIVPPAHYLPAMRTQVEALGRLVDDLFELARIDAGALSLELQEARIGDLVRSCVLGFEAEASARGVRLETRLADPLPPVRCAPDHVVRALSNLLVNALRHTPADGSVAVIVDRHDDDGVRVVVEDSGTGFSAAGLQRAFDRFWREDRARTGPRAGLGLAITRGLVEAQGGQVWAENTPGGGARMSFTLRAAAG